MALFHTLPSELNHLLANGLNQTVKMWSVESPAVNSLGRVFHAIIEISRLNERETTMIHIHHDAKEWDRFLELLTAAPHITGPVDCKYDAMQLYFDTDLIKLQYQIYHTVTICSFDRPSLSYKILTELEASQARNSLVSVVRLRQQNLMAILMDMHPPFEVLLDGKALDGKALSRDLPFADIPKDGKVIVTKIPLERIQHNADQVEVGDGTVTLTWL